MGNLIISNDYIEVAGSGVTPRSQSGNYEDVSVMDYWHLRRRFRANDLTKSDTNPLLRFDLSATYTITSIFLNDINFDKVRIKGHPTDLTTNWAAASFDSGADHTVSLDERVDRYKIYIPLTNFNYRWLAVMTPAAASAVGDYTTKWEVGSVVIMDSITTLEHDISYDYMRTSMKSYTDNALLHGGTERITLGSELQWIGDVTFSIRPKAFEEEIWDLNALDSGKPLLFYENKGEDDKAYLCLKDTSYEGTFKRFNKVESNIIRFKELV